MNWNAIQAVAELAAALGVLASLLYLASQVRAASLEGQRSRYNEVSSSLTDISRDWSISDTLSDIMFRGLRDPSDLEPDEIFRLYSSIYGTMKAWEAAYQYSLQRGVHAWGASGLRATMSSLMAFPGMQHYWVARRSWFSTDFQDEVDRVIQLGAPRMDEAYGDSVGSPAGHR
ncbi:MAG: hypothetical protein Q8W51_11485 [Candidatus Palauibacterales bacterium]|nr:hypothetical protein [Candidatus Palauibacterales bacterium]MDP2530343.1 hypothetical protein [Candidatus Palauibacterales bacterium]MDP2584928.1 hypothetical protein [Candidatus Palauibacterales bacterium]